MEALLCCTHCILKKPPRTPLPPPPTRLSTTNGIPSESEVRAMRERIHTDRTRLLEINSDITRLESLLGTLRREQQETRDNIDRYLAIISPIRSLPCDVLDEIFSWTLINPEENSPTSDFASGPWTLTHVCARWRNIAIYLPALW
ncbi:hypothetical protein C8J57DRAFT_1160735, partial [Mycena rebaudengoi]